MECVQHEAFLQSKLLTIYMLCIDIGMASSYYVLPAIMHGNTALFLLPIDYFERACMSFYLL